MLSTGVCLLLCLLASCLTYTSTTEIYTLSLHDALPISPREDACDEHTGKPEDQHAGDRAGGSAATGRFSSKGILSIRGQGRPCNRRSEEHTSELQSHSDLVCRLLLEKKKKNKKQKQQTYKKTKTIST